MKLIETLTYEGLVDLLYKAKKRLYISLPSIDKEVAEAITAINSCFSTYISIDNSEETIRNGFGEVSGIEKLREKGFIIRESAGNLISFIISDDTGYFIFPQSKIFSEKPKGPNAFKLDPGTIQLLIQSYFPANENSLVIKMTADEIIGKSLKYFENTLDEIQLNGSVIVSTVFNENKYEVIKKNLNLNPPLSPDLRRIINTYNAEIQFAELSFEGGNIQSRVIHYPKKALPVSSEELKQMLTSSMKLFGDLKGNPIFSKLNIVQIKLESIRAKYLISISCRPGKSILYKSKILSFEKELASLRQDIIKLQNDLPGMLNIEKDKTKNLIRNELIKFFRKNPPKELKEIQDKIKRQNIIDDFIEVIIDSIDFPDMQKLTERMILRCNIFDLTWDDFSDVKLLDEFSKKKILAKDQLDSIVAIKKAYMVKR